MSYVSWAVSKFPPPETDELTDPLTPATTTPNDAPTGRICNDDQRDTPTSSLSKRGERFVWGQNDPREVRAAGYPQGTHLHAPVHLSRHYPPTSRNRKRRHEEEQLSIRPNPTSDCSSGGSRVLAAYDNGDKYLGITTTPNDPAPIPSPASHCSQGGSWVLVVDDNEWLQLAIRRGARW